MLSRLSKPSDGPTVIAADSTEEALAFLAQLLSERGGEELALLWQIYSRCFSSLIQDRQYGHR